MNMTTTQIGTSTLYITDGMHAGLLWGRITDSSDLTPTEEWVPHFWFDQQYGVLIDLIRKTASIVSPSLLKQWRMTGVI